MSIPANKSELLNQICFEFERLSNELKPIPFSAFQLQQMEGHQKDTTMSLHNLLSYLIGWSNLVIEWKWNEEHKIAQTLPCNGYKWNKLGKLAQKFYADYAQIESEKLLKLYEKNILTIIDILNKENNQSLYELIWYKNYTFGRMVQLNTISPIKNAILRIRKFKKQQRIV